MRFELDDFDCAMGELFSLFERARLARIAPHVMDPELFHEAWLVLNAQPFSVRKFWFDLLMEKLSARSLRPPSARFARRYENAWLK